MITVAHGFWEVGTKKERRKVKAKQGLDKKGNEYYSQPKEDWAAAG